MNKYLKFKKISETLSDTYKNKNSDYGDSFAKVRDKYNKIFPVILIRLADKFSRLETLLLSGTQKVKSESIEDTLLDTAAYCIMEVIELRGGDK